MINQTVDFFATLGGAKGSGDSATARGLHGAGAIVIGATVAWVSRWLLVHANLDVDYCDAWIWQNIDPQLSTHTILTGIFASAWLTIAKRWRNSVAPETLFSTVTLTPAEAVGKAPVTSNTAALGAGDGSTITMADQTVEKLLDPIPAKGIDEPTSNT